MEKDCRRTKTSYVSLPFPPPLYFTLSVNLSRSQSTMPYVTHLLLSASFSPSLFLFLCCWLHGVRSNTILIYGDFLLLSVTFCILAPSYRLLLPFQPSSCSPFIQLKQCDLTVLMQHHANCQKSSGGLSPTHEFSTESNLAGDTEVRLKCIHFSTVQILLVLMASQLRPNK